MHGGERDEEHYYCATCQYTFAWGGACPRCDEPLSDVRVVPEWQRECRRAPAEQSRAASAVVAALLALLCAHFVLARALHDAVEAGSGAATLATVSLSLLSIAAIFATIPATRALTRALRSRNARRRREAAPVVSVVNATDGPVRIQGATRARLLANNPDHPPSLAYQQEQVAARKPTIDVVVFANGGEFELDDGSGSVAIVRAEHLHITDGVVVDGQLVVPVGSRIEVVGDGRWEMSTVDSVVAHNRSAARVLRVEGTAERPLLLRVIEAPAPQRDATGVRVSALEATDEPAEPQVDQRSTTASTRAAD